MWRQNIQHLTFHQSGFSPLKQLVWIFSACDATIWVLTLQVHVNHHILHTSSSPPHFPALWSYTATLHMIMQPTFIGKFLPGLAFKRQATFERLTGNISRTSSWVRKVSFCSGVKYLPMRQLRSCKARVNCAWLWFVPCYYAENWWGKKKLVSLRDFYN